jgi:hypothetical protein
MADENGSNEKPIQHSNGWDLCREIVRAIRDIFNDWRVATALLVVVLLLAGKVAGGDLMAGIESWIRAWKCTP